MTVPTTAGLIPILDDLFSRGKQVVLIGFDVGQDLGVLEADCGWTPPVGTEVIDTQSIAKTFFLQNDGVGLMQLSLLSASPSRRMRHATMAGMIRGITSS